MATEEYKVRLEVFEGPLDLLLYLIRKDEVEIYDIPIERITRQYMEYMDLMRMLDLNIAGDFLVMAATLMMIKSRTLLPIEEREGLPEIEEEEEDPRWDLVRQLVEYKKFKDVAVHLEDLEARQEHIFGREAEGGAWEDDPGASLKDVSIFDLISAFQEALKRVQREDLKEIFTEQFTVAEKIEEIIGRMQRVERLSFRSLFERAVSRHELVCTFLALLELIRLRQVRAGQESPLGDILILRGAAADEPPAPPDTENEA
ncbi:MAG: segregation/condensation protein A [Candidatus Marinimicrobia bacterium]|nr:segregation/condensation protein A [Candidatus Neomarinimicrobiota bacterium]